MEMNIHCRVQLVVFCQETVDNADKRISICLADKHMQLMYLISKHAKLHKGQMWRLFSLSSSNSLLP